MESQIKKNRSRNFTERDKNFLIQIVRKYANVIENKKTDNASVKEKNETWEKIAEEFNTTTQTGPRQPKQLLALYGNLKYKKKSNVNNDEKNRDKAEIPTSSIIDQLLENAINQTRINLNDDEKNRDKTNGSSVTPTLSISAQLFEKDNTIDKTKIDLNNDEKNRNKTDEGSVISTPSFMDQLFKKTINRKDAKDRRDDEIKNKKLEVLEIEKQIKLKELESIEKREEFEQTLRLKQLDAIENKEVREELLFQIEKRKRLLEVELLEFNLKKAKEQCQH